MIKKFFKIVFVSVFFLLLLVLGFFFVGKAEPKEGIGWGINFSQKHSILLGLNWRETYLALLDDLQAKRIKLITHWDYLEPKRDEYIFEDLDWQIREAQKRKAKILLVIGMKTPRWPECHLPSWAISLSKEEQQEEVLELLETIVLRYKNNNSIWAWQVENEPLFAFGVCPWQDEKFLEREVRLVKSLDPDRPIVLTDTGEWSLWFRIARLADIVGVTTYRKIWNNNFNCYFDYPLPAVFYSRKALLIEKLFGKKVIGVELQAEPWGPKLLYDLSLEEQKKSMDLTQFRKMIILAKKIGFEEFYLWGAEWWSWLKTKHNENEIWEEAKKVFSR